MQEPTGRPVWVDGHPTDRDAVVRSLAINRLRPFRHIVLIHAHSHPDHFVHSGELDSPEKEGEYMGLFRRDDDGGRFQSAIRGVVNRRLTYKALIGSELPQT